MAELKACPFCGAEARYEVGHSWAVLCEKCKARTGLTGTKEAATEAWNRRAASEDPYKGNRSRDYVLEAINKIADKRGWNGTDNSKFLEVFIEEKFAEADMAVDTLVRRVAVLEETCRRQSEQIAAGIEPATAPTSEEQNMRLVAARESGRAAALESELKKAKDLIYRMALKAL